MGFPAARRLLLVVQCSTGQRRVIINQIEAPTSPRARTHGIARPILKPQPEPPSWGLQVPPCTARISTPATTVNTAPHNARTARNALTPGTYGLLELVRGARGGCLVATGAAD